MLTVWPIIGSFPGVISNAELYCFKFGSIAAKSIKMLAAGQGNVNILNFPFAL